MTIAQFTVYAVAVSTGLINTILVILILKKDLRDIRNIVLALYITFLNIVLQAVSFLVVVVGDNLETVQLIMKFGQLILFIPVIMYIFARIYITGRVGLKHWLFLAPYTVAISVVSIFYTNELFTFVWSDLTNYYVILPNEPLYSIMLFAYAYLGIATYFFYKELKKETVPIRRTRLKYLPISPFFPAIGFLLITFPSIHILPWDMIGTTISTVLLTYAVIKHELLEIRVAIKESLVYTFFTVSVMLLFTLLSYIAIAFSHTPRFDVYNPITLLSILTITTTLYIIYRRGKTTAKLLEDERVIRTQIIDMISKTSHNLRTPLTAINGYLENLLSESDTFSPNMTHDINAITANTLRMSLHTENLLVYSQIMYEQKTPVISAIELNHVVEMASQQYLPLVAHRGLHLQIDLYPASIQVLAVNHYVRLAVHNLIANALQFTTHGRITVCTDIDEKFAKISVLDTGSGIDPEVLKTISTQTQSAGVLSDSTGIGLRLVGLMAQQQQGDFGADSTVGAGSTFWFTLPLKERAL